MTTGDPTLSQCGSPVCLSPVLFSCFNLCLTDFVCCHDLPNQPPQAFRRSYYDEFHKYPPFICAGRRNRIRSTGMPPETAGIRREKSQRSGYRLPAPAPTNPSAAAICSPYRRLLSCILIQYTQDVLPWFQKENPRCSAAGVTCVSSYSRRADPSIHRGDADSCRGGCGRFHRP